MAGHRTRDQQIETSAQLTPDLEAPVAKGKEIGKVAAVSNGKFVGVAPLVARANVERATFFKRM